MPEVNVRLVTTGFEQGETQANRFRSSINLIGTHSELSAKKVGRLTGQIANLAGANISGPLGAMVSSIGLIGSGFGAAAIAAAAVGLAIGDIVKSYENVKKKQLEAAKAISDLRIAQGNATKEEIEKNKEISYELSKIGKSNREILSIEINQKNEIQARINHLKTTFLYEGHILKANERLKLVHAERLKLMEAEKTIREQEIKLLDEKIEKTSGFREGMIQIPKELWGAKSLMEVGEKEDMVEKALWGKQKPLKAGEEAATQYWQGFINVSNKGGVGFQIPLGPTIPRIFTGTGGVKEDSAETAKGMKDDFRDAIQSIGGEFNKMFDDIGLKGNSIAQMIGRSFLENIGRRGINYLLDEVLGKANKV